MIGIDPSEQRGALEHAAGVLMHLLTKDEPISVETNGYRLVEARCQLGPLSYPSFDVGVAAIASPRVLALRASTVCRCSRSG